MTCNSMSGKGFWEKITKKSKKERKYGNVDKKLAVDTPRAKTSEAYLEPTVKHVRWNAFA